MSTSFGPAGEPSGGAPVPPLGAPVPPLGGPRAGEWSDPAERALAWYAATTSASPQPDLARRIEQRIAAEPPSTAPRRYLQALGALDAWATWRAFQQTLAAAIGRGAGPAPIRLQSLAAVLLTLVIVSGGGAAGVVGAGLLISELTADPQDQQPFDPLDVDTTPQPTITLEPSVTPEVRPEATREPHPTASPKTEARPGDAATEATPKPPRRPRQDAGDERDDQSGSGGQQDREEDGDEDPSDADDRSGSGDGGSDDRDPPDDDED